MYDACANYNGMVHMDSTIELQNAVFVQTRRQIDANKFR